MTMTKISLEPQPGSLIDKAFEAADGKGLHRSLGAYVAYCMNNGDQSAGLPRCLADAEFHGPELIALSAVRRTVGVGPKTEIDEDPCSFYGNIDRIEAALSDGKQPAPFIMTKRNNGWYYLLDGNHTKVALSRHGMAQWWAIIVESEIACEVKDKGVVANYSLAVST